MPLNHYKIPLNPSKCFFSHFFSAMCYAWGFFTAVGVRSTCRMGFDVVTTWKCYEWITPADSTDDSYVMEKKFPYVSTSHMYSFFQVANICKEKRLPIGQKKCGKSYYCGYCGRLNGFVAEWSFFPRGLLPHRPSMCDVQISDFVGRCPVGFWNRGWSLIDIPTLWGWFRYVSPCSDNIWMILMISHRDITRIIYNIL